MLKRISTLFFHLLIGLSCFALPIDQSSAFKKAKSFLNQRELNLAIDSSDALTANNMANTQETPYYIFNATDGNGFVIISGDDRTDPVLGYSDTGNIDPENIPDGLACILGRYEEEIKLIKLLPEEEVQQSAGRRVMSVARTPIAPLIKNYWGHMAPFNKYSPKVNDTTCVVSCAVVALGELMGFYKYPENSLAVDGYTTSTRGIELESLPSIAFDWANMRNVYKQTSYTSTEGSAVGWLMRYLGQALTSDYNATTSGTAPSKIPSLLKKYGYHTSDYWHANWKSMNEWEDVLYDQVTKGHPVMISGFSTGNTGHVFLCDGYDEDDYFHLEWGWEGSCRGYYKLTLLSPYKNVSDTYNYMHDLSFIFNIYPDNASSETEETEVATDDNGINNPNACLSLTRLTISGNKVTTKRTNELNVTKLYEEGLGLYDNTFKMVKLLANDTTEYSAYKSLTSTWSVSVGDMEDGTYRIYPISRLYEGGDIWHFDGCNSDNAYINVEITDGTAKFSAVEAVKYNSFEFVDTMPLHIGAVRRINLNVTNNMMEKYNNFLYLFDNGDIRQVKLENITKNTTGDIEFVYFPKTKGAHTLTISTDTTNTNIICSKEIEALGAVSYKLKFTYNIENYNEETNRVIGNKLRMKVTVTNTGDVDYNDYIRILRKYVYWDQSAKYFAHIPVGESQDFYYEENLGYGIKYNYTGLYKPSSTSNNNTFNLSGFSTSVIATYGINYWTADGTPSFVEASTDELIMPEDAVALDLTGLSKVPSNIVPNSNPNTLYYVTESYESLADCNQIVKLTANKIVLNEGYSCFVPRDFTAEEISYTRTFEKGFMGVRNQNNWSTIVLPFDVQTITNTTDNKEIDWFKPGDTTDKNFWLRRFYGEEGYYVYFTNAETFKAGTPYIITVPGDYKGEEYNLVGKPLTFSAVNAEVKSIKSLADAQHFDFEGSYSETTTKGKFVYQLDEDMNGNNFIYMGTSSTVKPFRAYFTSETEPIIEKSLYVASYIDVFEDTNAIENISLDSVSNNGIIDVYSISGTKVKSLNNASVSDALQSLPKGLYIINGKKYMR